MHSNSQKPTVDLPLLVNLPEIMARYGDHKPTFDFVFQMDIPGEFGKVLRGKRRIHYRDGKHSLECPMCGSDCQRLYGIGTAILLCEHCISGEQTHE